MEVTLSQAQILDTTRGCRNTTLNSPSNPQSDTTVRTPKKNQPFLVVETCVKKETKGDLLEENKKLERRTKVEETFIKDDGIKKNIATQDGNNVTESSVSLSNTNDQPVKAKTQGKVSPRASPSRRSPEATGHLRRSRSKLSDRTLARRKSFLKKGDGANLMAAKRLNEREFKSEEKCNRKEENNSAAKIKSSLLCLGRKKEATFVLRKRSSKTQTSSKDSSPRATKRKLTGVLSKPQRKHWNETGIKSFEKMIFSSIFAFSDELRESSENIGTQLQAMYDVFQGKTREVSAPSKTKSVFSQQWRQNNEDFLNSGCQEIAGIFRNLRKVETNLKAIENTITAINKLSLKERSNSPKKGCKILQKGCK